MENMLRISFDETYFDTTNEMMDKKSPHLPVYIRGTRPTLPPLIMNCFRGDCEAEMRNTTDVVAKATMNDDKL